MKTILWILMLGLAWFTGAALVGCEREQPMPTEPMSAEQLIRQHSNTPVEVSINSIVRALAMETVFVATEDLTPTKDGKIISTIRLKSGTDNQGRLWVYAYTSQAEFGKALPQGGPFAEISFRDVFQIVQKDQRFAGIILNSASNASFYPIPRELFIQVNSTLNERPNRQQ